MSDALNCPFCSVPSKLASKDFGNEYLFNCPNCGKFLMYRVVYRKIGKGEYADRKPMLLDFIRQTPEGRIAYIGSKVSAVEEENGLYCEYRPFKQS